ncbi:bifunctional metallophosphatase/5'-nucleotidase [Christensenellaceae bacterium OttesenSCG-928-L17]|nr:bifunctional metallophosphatase/5'-nucleotidase [Christensenellaceae bacterium OttesenSCG-928-L17]
MGKYKHLTLLHSNDLHGDFLSKELDEALLGGISMLSGYVNRVRAEVPNTLYCIAGDMLQGSVIDSEFRGLSTIEIMNLLRPDVASIGNHEVDYGLAHLLFLERCAQFPIVNANLFIKNPYTRLFSPYAILEVDGMKIMFIGIITNEIMMGIRKDVLASFVDVEDAAREVGHICNAYRNIDIDFTVLLTHIGFEEDKRLAALLDPDWGVDVIIGGHTHTILEKPVEVAGILIAQAGVGTKQIGRFDITVDTDTNAVHDYSWELIPIDSSHCPRNEVVEQTIRRFKEETDLKYNRVLCQFSHALTHPGRYQETELGNLFTDILRASLEVDIVLLGSGSIRKQSIQTLFTYGELMEVFPYDDRMLRLMVTGAQFKRMYRYTLRDEMLEGAHTEFYQYSEGLRVVFDKANKAFTRFDYNGAPLEDDRLYTIALQGFHLQNFESCFGFSPSELEANGKPRVLTTSVLDVLIEHLPGSQIRSKQVEGRLVIQ